MIKVDENGTITIIRGDSGFVTVPLIEIIDGEEVPYEPKPGDKLRFAASSKWGANKDECFIIREIPLTTNRLYFYPEDTKPMKFGTYKFDIEFTDSNGFVNTLIRGSLIIEKEVY